MKIKLFSDGANKDIMIDMYNNNLISGLTTNPTLMRKSGISNYKEFAKDVLTIIKDKPISFEVFSDDFDIMERQALEISSWGDNVYVKIPITNTKNKSSYNLIENLSKNNVKINVTAITTIEQVKYILPSMLYCPSGYISVFAGRISDTGIDPLPTIKKTIEFLKEYPNLELIWASCREIYNIVQADNVGCDIITITNDIFNKLHMINKDLNDVSIETVKMFYYDSLQSGFYL